RILTRRLFLAALPLAVLAIASPSWAADKIKVVATFTILGDTVRSVGGENVAVVTLVAPDGDAHVYEPTPADARALAEAALASVDGLGSEGWIDRLIEASGYRGPVVVASEGVAPLEAEEEHAHDAGETAGEDEEHHHDGLDPHAWQ